MKNHWMAGLTLALAAGLAFPVWAMPADNCGTCYEVFVYSFCDSNGDGIGDLPGLTGKLDYINDNDPQTDRDLGCDMIWLMPVFPSPTYHKYDATDFTGIDPAYGTLEDFTALAEAAHDRGIRLILDLPVNHTSTEHPWFAQASEYLRGLSSEEEINAADCPEAAYYHFSTEPQTGYAPLAGTPWYYEAQFWEGMPDLNLDNPEVVAQIHDAMAFWMEKGADGFRLDAVTSYYTGDNQANIRFLTDLASYAKEQWPDIYMVGECWADQQTYAKFYESGIDSFFDFDFAGPEGVITRTVKGSVKAAAFGKRLAEEQALFAENGQQAVNAPFFTNHDMARSAGYFTKDDGTRVRFAWGLNMMIPGNAFLYYGEELGMKGSGIDENKRAPMYWSADPDAPGMCVGPPAMEEVRMKYGSWEEQNEDEGSILSYVRKAIHLRMDHPAIRCGTVTLDEDLSNDHICVLRYTTDEEQLSLIVNTFKEADEITLPETPVIADTLSATGEEPVLSENTIVLPPFTILVVENAD